MSDTSVGGADGPIFREIGQAQPQAAIPFLSPQGLAVAATVALALKATLSLVEIVGLAMRVKVIGDARRLGAGLAATLQSDAHLADTVVQASGLAGDTRPEGVAPPGAAGGGDVRLSARLEPPGI